jgi:D-serine deaminase-like pyridoxal phosphate-dependent protein
MAAARTTDDLATPVLLLDWPAAKRNIDTAAKFVEGRPVRLRPHFKNHKCAKLASEQIAAGGCIGMTAATVDEAAVLIEGGIDDVLIANQVVGTAKVRRLVELAGKATVRLAVDCIENAAPVGEIAKAAGIEVGVLVEVDIGMDRSGVQPGKEAVEIAGRISELPGIRFDGIQAYHGNVVGIVDNAEREAQAISTMEQAISTRHEMEKAGIGCSILSGAGTGTYRTAGAMEGVDELQIGSYVTMDWSYQERVDEEFDIALSVLTSVISAQDDRCILDVGVKGVAHEFGPPRVLDLDDYEVGRFGSEEHTKIIGTSRRLKVGDRVRLYPSHSCATCNLHRQMVVCEGDEIRDIWPIAGNGYPVLSK